MLHPVRSVLGSGLVVFACVASLSCASVDESAAVTSQSAEPLAADAASGDGAVADGAKSDAQAQDAASSTPVTPVGDLGTTCTASTDCLDLCVVENSTTKYCSQACSAQMKCPDGYDCDSATKACFALNGWERPCTSGADCRSGICVHDSHGQYCSEACSTTSPKCPAPATCSTSKGACFLPASSSSPDVQATTCSIPGAVRGTDPTKPIPWYLGFTLIGLLRLRRRRA